MAVTAQRRRRTGPESACRALMVVAWVSLVVTVEASVEYISAAISGNDHLNGPMGYKPILLVGALALVTTLVSGTIRAQLPGSRRSQWLLTIAMIVAIPIIVLGAYYAGFDDVLRDGT